MPKKVRKDLLTNLGLVIAAIVIAVGLFLAVASGQEFKMFFVPVPNLEIMQIDRIGQE